MPYLQQSETDRKAMLAALDIEAVEDLFEIIPEDIRLGRELNIEGEWTERELKEHIREIGSWNRQAAGRPCFLGGGVYDHDWPAIVDHLAGRSEFLTAYTPYQPECSQGTLQWIFEFQSLIAEICGTEVANASMYDGASACAEAALMATGATQRKRVVISAGLHPHSREAICTYLRHGDIEVIEAPLKEGATDWGDLVNEETAAVFVQQPNFLGIVEDLDIARKISANSGAWAVASIYPIAMGLLRSPGAAGFDLVVGDGQSLGVPMGLGGPSFGFFAASGNQVRRLPGRLVGQSVDSEDRRAFTLTFQTREQHIRREKATSNICTNNALIALRGCIHMAALGPKGIEEVACLSRQRALELETALTTACASISRAFPQSSFFNEIPFRAAGGEESVKKFKSALSEAGIAGVLPMTEWYPEMAGVFTLACTERTRSEDIARVADIAAEVLPAEAIA